MSWWRHGIILLRGLNKQLKFFFRSLYEFHWCVNQNGGVICENYYVSLQEQFSHTYTIVLNCTSIELNSFQWKEYTSKRILFAHDGPIPFARGHFYVLHFRFIFSSLFFHFWLDLNSKTKVFVKLLFKLNVHFQIN